MNNIQVTCRCELLYTIILQQKIIGKSITKDQVDQYLKILGLEKYDYDKLKIAVTNSNEVNISEFELYNLNQHIKSIIEFVNIEFIKHHGLHYTVFLLIKTINKKIKKPAPIIFFDGEITNLILQLRNLLLTGRIQFENGFIAKKNYEYIKKVKTYVQKLKEEQLAQLKQITRHGPGM